MKICAHEKRIIKKKTKTWILNPKEKPRTVCFFPFSVQATVPLLALPPPFFCFLYFSVLFLYFCHNNLIIMYFIFHLCARWALKGTKEREAYRGGIVQCFCCFCCCAGLVISAFNVLWIRWCFFSELLPHSIHFLLSLRSVFSIWFGVYLDGNNAEAIAGRQPHTEVIFVTLYHT